MKKIKNLAKIMTFKSPLLIEQTKKRSRIRIRNFIYEKNRNIFCIYDSLRITSYETNRIKCYEH